MDVKAGSGAFMARTEEARGLAESLVTVANGAGLPTRALLTDMDQPSPPSPAMPGRCSMPSTT